MRNLFKKGLSAAIALSMAASMAVMVPTIASAEVTTGTWVGGYADGDGGTWSYDDSTDTLTVEGVGRPKTIASGGNEWNDQLSTVKHIVVGDGITHIRNYMFESARNLESLQLPDSVEMIGTNAFIFAGQNSDPENMTLTLPANLKIIGGNAFDRARFSGTLTLPSSLTNLGELAFNGNKFTGEVVIPASVTSFGTRCFQDNDGLTIKYAASPAVVETATAAGEVGATGFKRIIRGGIVSNSASYTYTWNVTSGGTTKTFEHQDNGTVLTLSDNAYVGLGLIVKHLADPNATAYVTFEME